MEKKFTCVVCPIGCELHVKYDENDLSAAKIEVSGNTCPRGEKYAKAELIHPERTLTSVIRTDSEILPMLPVKTSSPIPKEKLFDAIKFLNTLSATVPVDAGGIIYKDFITSGTNLVACRSIKK